MCLKVVNVVSHRPGNLLWSAVATPEESPAATCFKPLQEPRPPKELSSPRRKRSGSSQDAALPSLAEQTSLVTLTSIAFTSADDMIRSDGCSNARSTGEVRAR